MCAPFHLAFLQGSIMFFNYKLQVTCANANGVLLKLLLPNKKLKILLTNFVKFRTRR